jgi:integrase
LLALYAVALEILTICPLRRDNLARLRLDRNLCRANPGGPIVHLYLSGEEVKNREAIHWPIPPESARRIELYLQQHRPLLTEPGNLFLFPNGGLGHRAAHDLAVGLTERVERDIGVEFNLHLMRHLAVLVYLNEHPGQYEVVSRVLGHRKVETTKTFYAGLEADAAVRSFLETIMANRKGTRLLATGAAGKLRLGGRRR